MNKEELFSVCDENEILEISGGANEIEVGPMEGPKGQPAVGITIRK
ncbi:MAG: hypothetical protein HUJ68_03805 [Clostridia bacterium]|nr:hypothetical protein [Clostridia bacterium]